MIHLASLIEQFEPAFLAQHGDRLQPEQHQALTAMKACRTALSPKMQASCPACEEQLWVPHSCGHRLCPTVSTTRASSGWSANSKPSYPASTSW